ncbi:TraR/DksA C4-type zinc finger protein [Marinobacter subterrani]|uniref:Transcriptional regulator, TraR/DksA family n=1 Tax=Marinobacter subterrani TaxID=1658765 RepID=A0A0J7J789_9GAMM|nr:TraR/DksA C4-type zinc finger protein [Marinobacter subterrani]KMQ74017.1 transcriptional regulator, TraR/DksA family [Marinobacter subterrani]
MDERSFEEAQALTERLTRAGIEQALQVHLEPPLEINGQRLCRDCDSALGAPRLRANPNAVRCVACQTDHDRRGA